MRNRYVLYMSVLAIVFSLANLLGLSKIQAQCGIQFNNNGSALYVACGDPLPNFDTPTATNACCSSTNVQSFITQNGSPETTCALTTAMGPGPDRAIWLPGVSTSSEYWDFDGAAQFEQYADGTARIWGHIHNQVNSSEGFDVSIWLKNGRDWAAWSALGRGYKDDFNLAAQTHADWTYYELVNDLSIFEGTGSLSGSHLFITHYPINLYYGFQTGLAANDRNSNEGLSGWFGYHGVVNGQNVSNHGDINVDQACQVVDNFCAATYYTRYSLAQDACGNYAFASQTLYVTDEIAPVFEAFPTTIQLACEDVASHTVSAQDNCSGVQVTFQDEILVAGCNGQLIRHYLATDGCGNTSDAQQTIILFGGLPPEFVIFPADTTISCDQLESLAEPTITYNPGCQNTVLNQTTSQIARTCPGNYTIERTFTLTDDCGNQVSRSWMIHLEDHVAPVLFNVPDDITLSCGQPVPDAVVFALDNCAGSPVVGTSANTVPQQCGYEFVRTWFTDDGCGNSVSASQTITFLDNTPPQFGEHPSVLDFPCGTAPQFDAPSVSDACSEFSVSFEDAPVTTGCQGSFIRTYEAIDACGNSTSTSIEIHLFDDQPPVFTQFPEDVVIGCNESASPEQVEVAWSDNCGEVSVSVTSGPEEQLCANSFIQTYTWTLTDACGNQTSRVWTVYSLDEEAPVLSGVPADTTIGCGAQLPEVNVVAIDACQGDVAVFFNTETTQLPNGNTQVLRTWSAIDSCGNAVSATQTTIIIESQPPVFGSFPDALTFACGDTLSIPTPEATSSCSAVTVTFEDAPIADDCAGSFIRTWTATDSNGASTSADQIIFITDDQAPIFTFTPVDELVNCGQSPTNAMATASDLCSNVEVTYEDQPLNDCIGSYVRIFIATDACGNVATYAQTISIVDLQAPQAITFPENQTVQCAAEIPTFTGDEVTFDDACSSFTVTSEETIETGDCPNHLVVSRIWTATDACGNVGTHTWTITVQDDTGPELIGVPDNLRLQCGIDVVPPPAVVTAIDNCGETSEVSYTQIQQNLQCGYRLRRRWTSTDLCGNETSREQIITVTDTIAPQFSNLPQDMTVGCNEPLPPMTTPTATDACAGQVVVFTAINTFAGDCPGAYYQQRVFRAFDNCGNSAIYAQLITVRDQEAPVFDPYITPISGVCGQPVPNTLTAQDACNTYQITSSDEFIGGGCSGTIVRTYTATDACGNASTAIQAIQLTDNTPPVFDLFPQDISVSCDAVPDANEAGIQYSDNCSDVVLSVTEEVLSGTCNNEYTLERNYTLTDGCGNENTRTWTIQVSDNTPPTLTGVPDDAILECGASVPDAVVFGLDNCDGVVPVGLTASTQQTDCGSILTRTWFTEDNCGNQFSATQTITFVDNTPPVLNNTPSDITLNCGDPIPPLALVSATDACQGPLSVEQSERFVGVGSCPNILRTWCATDCAGNQTCYTQTISFNGATTPGGIQLLRVSANEVRVSFEVKADGASTVQLRDISGKLLSELYNGICLSGTVYNTSIDTSNLPNGIYLVQLNNSSTKGAQKLIVAH